MIAGDKVTLKATGESVLVLQTLGNGRSFCQLPPQAPWHRPRYQVIRDQKLK